MPPRRGVAFQEDIQRLDAVLREINRDAVKTDAAVKQVRSETSAAKKAIGVVSRSVGRLDQGLTSALRALNKMSDEGVSAESIRDLRQKIETLEGATTGVTRASPLLSLIPHPGARLGAAILAGGIGALEGGTRESRRQRARRAGDVERDRAYQFDLEWADRAEERERAAASRRRARKGIR